MADEIWLNNIYQVFLRRLNDPPAGWPPLVHLSVKRVDKEPIHDWRDLQRIKNELVGPECEGVELYPAESRLVDSANQYHLWVIAVPGTTFPFGFRDRLVSQGGGRGSKQRDFDEAPPDSKSFEQVVADLQEPKRS
jgi:hypothetical protein